MSFTKAIENLIAYGNSTGILPKEENAYAVNRLLALFKEDSFDGEIDPEFGEIDPKADKNGAESSASAVCDADKNGARLEPILKELLDYAAEKGLLTDNITVYRDLFDAEIMNCVMPRPLTVIDTFNALKKEDCKAATDWFYRFSQDTDYIRRYRLCKDVRYTVGSEYGEIVVTINLSKPEKDPRAIAAAGKAKTGAAAGSGGKASGEPYPRCQLCRENEGYAGRVNHPGRANHRILPITIGDEVWDLQYSPYGYYNEHCILLNPKHVPMVINRAAFDRLLTFVAKFPHYMIGSNADLPIVGGSILSHDHYQGGRFDFPMALAKAEISLPLKGFDNVSAGLVHWPLTVIRLSSEDREALSEAAERVLTAWRSYDDPDFNILHASGDEKHNTVTPIARMRDGKFELDLVLRNNRTTAERPYGLFHPREEYHHIKKENIGLIEVMGVAVLPSRLKEELRVLLETILSGEDPRSMPGIEKHADWAEDWMKNYSADELRDEEKLQKIIDCEVGKVFVKVLEDCGVYPWTEEGRAAVLRFMKSV